MIEDDNRRAAGERLALYAFIGLMAGLLIVMGHNVRSANLSAAVATARAGTLERQLAISDELVAQLTSEHDLMIKDRQALKDQIAFLAAGPSERIIIQPCADPTPVFSRDSQFSAK